MPSVDVVELSLVLFTVVVTSLVDHDGVLALTGAPDEAFSDLAGHPETRNRSIALKMLFWLPLAIFRAGRYPFRV